MFDRLYSVAFIMMAASFPAYAAQGHVPFVMPAAPVMRALPAALEPHVPFLDLAAPAPHHLNNGMVMTRLLHGLKRRNSPVLGVHRVMSIRPRQDRTYSWWLGIFSVSITKVNKIIYA